MTKRRVRTRGAKRGSTFVVGLSEPARLEIRFQRIRPGRMVKGRCAKASRRNRHRRACTRFVGWGRALRTATEAQGTARVTFSGKLHGHRLPLGRWRALIVAIDAAGNRSLPRRLRFSVIRSR
jgi:hypothetical protein